MNSIYLTKKIIILVIIILALFVMADKAEAAYDIKSDIRQVKTAYNSAVYYLDHNQGLKKAYINATSYLAYNNKWDDIKVVTDEKLDEFPDVKLIKTSDSPRIYYVKDNKKAQIISPTDFINFGFNWGDIVTVNKIDFEQYVLTDYNGIGLTYSVTSSKGEIFIKLDSSSPQGNLIPVNTINNLVAIFNFRAEEEITEIKSLKLNLKGVFNLDVLDKVYITDDDGTDFNIQASINSREANFNFGEDTFIIREGEEREIKVFINFADYQDCENNTLQISINSAEDINTASSITGDFPVEANIFNLINANDNLGSVKIEEKSVNINTTNIGSTGQTINKTTIYETSGNENIIIKEISFIEKGSAVNSDLGSFKLLDERGTVVAQVSEMQSGDIVKFTLNDYVIDKSKSNTFIVTSDILGGEGKKINLQFYEIKVIGSEYGFNLKAIYIDLSESIEINREYLGVVAEDLKDNKKVFAEQPGVIIGNFQIRNNNQEVYLQSLNFSLEKNASAPNLDSTVYLVNYESGEIYGTFSGIDFVSGIININLNNIKLDSKESLTITLITDMPNGIKNGDSYRIYLEKINYKAENGLYYADNVIAPGVLLTVNTSNAFIYSNNEFTGINYTKGQEDIKIASFIVEAAAGDDIIINSITFTKGNTSGTISYNNGFSNMKAYVGSKRSNNIISQPLSDNFTFEGFNYRLRAGDRVEIKIYVNTTNDLKVSETQLGLTNIAVIGYESGIPTVINGLNTLSNKVLFGEAKMSISALSGGAVVVGEDYNLVASFKVKNLGVEKLLLKYLTINTSTDGFSYSLGYNDLRIVNRSDSRRVGGNISRPVAGANKIDLGSYEIVSGEELTFDVYVDAEDSAPTGSFQIYFSELLAKGRYSKIEASISGDPTGNVTVSVN